MKKINKLKMNHQQPLFFSTPENAGRHIRYHLLSSPECHAWEVIHPDKNFADTIAVDGRLFSTAKEVLETFVSSWDSGRNRCEEHWLYNYYLQAVEKEIASALFLGWFAVEPGNDHIQCRDYSFDVPENVWEKNVTFVMLSPTGAFIIIERSFDKDANYRVLRLTTFFFAGLGDPEATRKTKESPDNLFRNSEPAAQRGITGKLTNCDLVKKRKREENYTREEWIYYTCFRPAWQRIRQEHWVNQYVKEDKSKKNFKPIKGSHMALLKETFRKLNEQNDHYEYRNFPKFEAWLPLYQKTEHFYNKTTKTES